MAKTKGGSPSTPEGADSKKSAPKGVSAEVVKKGTPQPRDFKAEVRQPTVTEKQLSRPVAELGHISAIDEKLLRMAAANKSMEEMGEEVGIDPAKAGQRVKDILGARNWLDLLEKESLVLDKIYEVIEVIDDMIVGTRNTPDPFGEDDWDGDPSGELDVKLLNTKVKAISVLLTQLNKRREAQTKEKMQIKSSHAMIMGMAIEASFSRFAFELKARYPQISENELREIMADAIPRGIKAIDDRMNAQNA